MLLSNEQITEKLTSFPDWEYKDAALHFNRTFGDFAEAMVFVNKTAVVAEQLNHHPDILIYNWNKVKLTVSTHSEGGVTELDFVLIGKLD